MVALVKKIGGVNLIEFGDTDMEQDIANQIQTKWFKQNQFNNVIPTNPDEIEVYLDRGQARQLSQFFDSIIGILDKPRQLAISPATLAKDPTSC